MAFLREMGAFVEVVRRRRRQVSLQGGARAARGVPAPPPARVEPEPSARPSPAASAPRRGPGRAGSLRWSVPRVRRAPR